MNDETVNGADNAATNTLVPADANTEDTEEINSNLPQKSNNDIIPTMWNDSKLLEKAYKAARYLSSSALVPNIYQSKPENCLIALDISNRLNISPLLVMQNLYIVQGKPAWSGSFCASAINGCGKFEPLEYVESDEHGGSCCVTAVRIRTGKLCKGATISMEMARGEGWTNKNGSKWATMPEQMLRYRAASFFARTFCPEVLLGVQTVEEISDVYGAESQEKKTITIELKGEN